MKILFLTHTFPYPLNEGVRLHIYHILKNLSQRHEIFLICLNDKPVSKEESQAIESLGVKIITALPHKVPQSFILRLWNTLFDLVPFCVRQFESKTLRNVLTQFFKEQTVDLVHVDYISMAVYRDIFTKVPAIFFPHDAVSMMYERNIKSETKIFRKIYTYMQWKKIVAFESKVLPQFNATMVVSPVDKKYLLQHSRTQEIYWSPNGVDTEYFFPQSVKEDPETILFRGVMNFLPNVDAVRYFYDEIFPLIRKEIPTVRFVVVGHAPMSDLVERAKKDPQFILTGYVDDLREWMAKSTVIVSPMRIGSGIKNKVLEPMAMGKCLVATTMSCVGLEVNNTVDIELADDPKIFANKVIALLKDPKRREEIGSKALTLVKEKYTWEKNAADFEKCYTSVVSENH